MRGSGRATAISTLLLGVVVVLAYGAFLRSTAFRVGDETWYSLFDDAMISMRYAQHLAGGEGLRWNPGEPAVEGYTNFLWTLAMAAAHLLPVGEGRISLVVMILGALVLLAGSVVVGALAFRLTCGSRAAALASGGAAALYYPAVFWTLRGMEVGLVTLLVGWGALAALRFRDTGRSRDSAVAGVALGLAVLTRIDALVPAGIVGVFLLLAGRGGSMRRAAAPYAAVVLGTLALHTAFRLAYYGDVLPNTYYLKVTGIALSERFGRGAWAFGELVRLHLWPLLVALGLAALLLRRRLLQAPATLLVALFAGQCLYSVAVGGDAWEWMDYSNRFVATGVPLLFPVIALAAREVARGGYRSLGWRSAERPEPRAEERPERPSTERSGTGTEVGSSGWPADALPVAALLAIVLLLDALPVRQWWSSGPFHVGDDARMTRVGLELRDATEPAATVAVVWAGAVPYFARRCCVDLLGKNDPVVARGPSRRRFKPGHDKWSYRHSIGVLQPDVILQTSFVWSEPGFWSFVARGYDRLENGICVRRDSHLVDRDALSRMEDPNL